MAFCEQLKCRIATKALQILLYLFTIFVCNAFHFVLSLINYHSGYHIAIKSPHKQNQGIAQKILGKK